MVHSIELMHSSTVVKTCILPIGMLSEEAQEARNKDVRKYKENFARKCCRKRNMEDVIKKLCVNSDPYISQLTMKYNNKRPKQYTKELTGLLLDFDV